MEKLNLPLLTIESAEELQKFALNREPKLENSRLLSEIIEKEFSKNFNYASIFSDAYFATYDKRIPPMLKGSPKIYREEISGKLKYPEKLGESELKQLTNFCINFSDSLAQYEEELKNMRGSCFR